MAARKGPRGISWRSGAGGVSCRSFCAGDRLPATHCHASPSYGNGRLREAGSNKHRGLFLQPANSAHVQAVKETPIGPLYNSDHALSSHGQVTPRGVLAGADRIRAWRFQWLRAHGRYTALWVHMLVSSPPLGLSCLPRRRGLQLGVIFHRLRRVRRFVMLRHAGCWNPRERPTLGQTPRSLERRERGLGFLGPASLHLCMRSGAFLMARPACLDPCV